MWKEEFNALSDYVKNNPSIILNPKTISMEKAEREYFYGKLDIIKNAFIEENFGDWLHKSSELIEKWNEAKEQVINATGVARVVLDDQLERFFEDPKHLLNSLINKDLMDVYIGLSSIEDFEKNALSTITEKFKELYHRGYEYWAILWFIVYLDPEETWGVLSKDYNAAPQVIEMSSTGGCQDVPPWPIEVEALSFEKAFCCTYLTSRIIIKSRKFGRFVAIRPNPYEPHWWTELRSKNQEWFDFEREIIKPFGAHDLMPGALIYVADDLRDLQLVQDRRFFCRPHILVEFEDEENWFDNKGVKLLKRHNYALRPKCGSIILSKEHFDIARMAEALKPEKIDPATLGYWPEEEEIDPEDPTANWPGEPNMNIVPIEIGWNHENMEKAFTEMIEPIPPYPPVDW